MHNLYWEFHKNLLEDSNISSHLDCWTKVTNHTVEIRDVYKNARPMRMLEYRCQENSVKKTVYTLENHPYSKKWDL